MPLAEPGYFDNTISFIGMGAHPFQAHEHCPVVRLPDWPHECPAMYNPSYEGHVLMLCTKHRNWWHMEPPNERFTYWMPPLDTVNADLTPPSPALDAYYKALTYAYAWEGAPNIHSTGMHFKRERHEFLRDVIITALELGLPTGFYVRTYHPGAEPTREDPTPSDVPFAEVIDIGDDDDLDTDNAEAPILRFNIQTLTAAFAKLRLSITDDPTNGLGSTFNLRDDILWNLLLGDIRCDGSNIDKECAEVMLQIAVLGEVRYS